MIHDAGGDVDADISNFMWMSKHIQKDGCVELINIQSADDARERRGLRRR